MQAEIYLISYILSLLQARFARLGRVLSRTCVILFPAARLIFYHVVVCSRLQLRIKVGSMSMVKR